MKRTKLLTFMVTITLILSLSATNVNAMWSDYLGFDGKPGHTWYEAANGSVLSNTKTSWAVGLTQVGWAGIWGAQMSTTITVPLTSGDKYQLHCVLKSTGCNKWIFIQIGIQGLISYGKWVWLPKGKKVIVNETFMAIASTNIITFGFGGEYGDRQSTDGFTHYAYAGGANIIAARKDADGDSGPHDKTFTVISCSKFYLGAPIQKTSFQKIKRTSNKAKITIKKLKNIKGYEVQYSTTKKFKAKSTKTITAKKNTCTIRKLKKNKKYYIRTRAFVNTSSEKVYGKWSKVKTIPKK